MLACLLALTLAFPIQDTRAPGPLWRIGWNARRVAEVPPGDDWASDGSFIRNGPPTFEVEEREGALDVRAFRHDGYSSDAVRFRLTAERALAGASSGSCTHFWLDPLLAGTACVITDGTRAALDFEVYEGAGISFPNAYFGRIQLGAPGVALAEAVLARAAEAEPFVLERLAHTPGASLLRESRARTCVGLVDGLGRRQGPWTVRDFESDAVVVEMSWRNGRPEGVYQVSWGDSRTVGSFRAGLQDGESIWYGNGERRVARYSMGRTDGAQTTYDAHGRRRLEITWVSGVPTRHREWSDGVLVEDRDHGDADGLWVRVRDQRAAVLDWLDGLYTRQEKRGF